MTILHLPQRGFAMAYSAAGRGRPVLFVHGYPLNRQMWQPQIEGLANLARILAPDLRGHGESGPVEGPYSVDIFADDLAAFLDGLGIRQKIVLCGLSMGGYIAFAFYRKYADRLSGLILTATRAAADTPQNRLGRDHAAELACQLGLAAIVETMLPKLFSPAAWENQPELVVQARQIMAATPLAAVLGDLEALKERPDSTPTLATIRLPVLVLPGAQDQIIPLAEAQALAAAIPGAQMQVIPDAGHLPNLENPAAFNAAVRAFLNNIPVEDQL